MLLTALLQMSLFAGRRIKVIARCQFYDRPFTTNVPKDDRHGWTDGRTGDNDLMLIGLLRVDIINSR